MLGQTAFTEGTTYSGHPDNAIVDDWKQKLTSLLEGYDPWKQKLTSLLEGYDPKDIFNMDET